jgi:hypothetical protein
VVPRVWSFWNENKIKDIPKVSDLLFLFPAAEPEGQPRREIKCFRGILASRLIMGQREFWFQTLCDLELKQFLFCFLTPQNVVGEWHCNF